jgi:hypothetical protein
MPTFGGDLKDEISQSSHWRNAPPYECGKLRTRSKGGKMLLLRPVLFSVAIATFCVPCIDAQENQNDTKASAPQPKPLPDIPSPSGFLTFNANCFNYVSIVENGPLAVVWNSQACPAKSFLPTDVKPAVTAQASSAGDLSSALLTANSNFKAVQQAVIDSLSKVLDDQSIKIDNVKDVINAASEQIAANVTQSMQKAIQAEVARQLKDAQKK